MDALPTQVTGAYFLAERQYALLADAPRCGKTGAAILGACTILNLKNILVVTTSSGRGVWVRGFQDWAGRLGKILNPAKPEPWSITVVGWPNIASPKVRSALMRKEWDLVILDECHFAKSVEAKRTQAAFGEFREDGFRFDRSTAITAKAKRIWLLSGTPIPHSPADLYPALRALWPERLVDIEPKVLRNEDFLRRYTIRRPKRISNFRSIQVIIKGQNEDELARRLDGLWLRRTQQDVGIRAPIYETLPLVVSQKQIDESQKDLKIGAVLTAARDGDTKSLEMHLGPLRRLTGEIKAHAVVDAVHDEFDGGLDKIVLMYWHKDVGNILAGGLAKFGVSRIDGATTDRETQVRNFNDKNRVFLGQIQAAGEAIDLSAAAVLFFVETSFTPAAMAQAALRITNIEQKRQAFVKVVTLAGSIDEAIQARLLSLWSTIREVMK